MSVLKLRMVLLFLIEFDGIFSFLKFKRKIKLFFLGGNFCKRNFKYIFNKNI